MSQKYNPEAAFEFRSTQERLQDETYEHIEAGRLSDAAGLVVEASACVEGFTECRLGQPPAVDAAVQFNETLHTLLNSMVESGHIDRAKRFAGQRIRSTSNPYEASGLRHWTAMEEAQKGHFRSAEIEARTSEEIAEAIGSPWLAAQAERMLVSIYSDMHNEPATREVLAKALDNIERGQRSELYLPDNYKTKIAYGVKNALRYYLGHRMFFGREREARDFCNETLTATGNPNRRGFYHHWMGQAEIMHARPIGKSGRYSDVTQAAIHLKAAEDYFKDAGEPVYAAFVVLDQGSLGDMPRALERGRVYVDEAIEQYKANESLELHREIDDLVRQYSDAELRTFVTNN